LNHLTVPVAIFLVPSIRVVDLDFEIASRGAFLSAPSENAASVPALRGVQTWDVARYKCVTQQPVTPA
jgi:hypothetical protein